MTKGLMLQRCPSGGQCVPWVQRYIGECVCDGTDELSVALGLISVFCWAVAEIPQIVTNCISHSADGVSLGFLMTWLVGDSFNLIGCFLKKGTLPTQIYVAMLYTITTVILVLQTIYYGYICRWWKARKMRSIMKEQLNHITKESNQNYDKLVEPLNVGVERRQNSTGLPSSIEGTLPIPTPSDGDLYYTSARSLSSSSTPIIGSYLLSSHTGSRRSNSSYTLNRSPVQDQEGLLTSYVNTSPTNTKSTLLHVVVGTTLFISGLNLHLHAHNITTSSTQDESMEKGFVIHLGRKLLQEINGVTFKSTLKHDESISAIGTYLGWLMAIIYIGGRLPQIYLNIKRGTMKGLNPFMFTFAVIGNATYVGSIIIRTTKWEIIKPNMPWLVYSFVCVLLDCLILAQFIYYQTQKAVNCVDDDGAFEEAKEEKHFGIAINTSIYNESLANQRHMTIVQVLS